MAALVQSFPSSSSTMLQSGGPSSSSAILPPPSSQNQAPSRNNFVMTSSTYRAPVAPYAFTSTPALNSTNQRPQAAARTSSAPPNIPAYQQVEHIAARSRYPATASTSTTSSSSSDFLAAATPHGVTRDDSALISTARIATRSTRPVSTIITSSSLTSFAIPTPPVKASPDRYRRPAMRRVDSPAASVQSNSGGQNLNHIYGHTMSATPSNLHQDTKNLPMPLPQVVIGNFDAPNFSTGSIGSVDDMQLNRPQDQATSRYRRRSIHTIDAADYSKMADNSTSKKAFQPSYSQVAASSSKNEQHPLRSSPVAYPRPASSHGRTESAESLTSLRSSNHSRSNSNTAPKREGSGPPITAVSPPLGNPPEQQQSSDQIRLVNIPPRTTSDTAKRVANPSPLSKPVTMSPDSPTAASKDSFASAVASLQTPAKPSYAQVATNGLAKASSPAAQQLAAISGKETKKTKTSRLRRAFSFGSAAELRRASAENSFNAGEAAADRSKLRKERYQDAQEAEQARIAEQQEAGGIGESIYSGQGNFFTGSTDNLSISSTASSASIMIRKMGKSMKKSTRSLAGLFRPKSVIGVPAADSAIGSSAAQVSMVTVEAEREKVNINANPHDQAGGGTGFPKLERNSLDAASAATFGNPVNGRAGSPTTESSNANSRKSIIGGERERAEILNAVKKGILKRTGTGTSSGNSSPIVKPSDNKTANYTLPMIPHVNDSPTSSTPSTPNDDARRTDSLNLPDEDYFMAAVRFRADSKSAPGTPQSRRNVTFNLQLNNHDTWPSGEYDRRGEIATCNRLTPMLAQQIKEELNTFKMEMEVHDSSKIYTHFF